MLCGHRNAVLRKEEKKYMVKNYLKCLIIIISTHFILLFPWIITTKYGFVMAMTNITFFETLIDIFLPVGIIIFLFIKKMKAKWFFVEIFISIFLGLLGNSLHYFNWGVSTKMFFHPDGETKLLFQLFSEINIYSLLFLGILFQIILLIKIVNLQK